MGWNVIAMDCESDAIRRDDEEKDREGVWEAASVMRTVDLLSMPLLHNFSRGLGRGTIADISCPIIQ